MQAKILIVEDDVPVAMMLTYLLTRAGCKTETASTGEKAIKMAQAGTYDLITLDVDLPDMDGYEICNRLKANPTFQTSIVFVSGRQGRQDIQRGLESGAIAYLFKPFGTDFATQLLAYISEKCAA